MNIKDLLVALSLVLVLGTLDFLYSIKVPDNLSIPDPAKCMGVGFNCGCPIVSTDKGWQQGSCIKEKT